MQLKALTTSGTGMTDEQCNTDKMRGLTGGRLTTGQVLELVGSGRSWVSDCRGKVPVNLGCYRARAPAEIAAPRQVGARNDKGAWCWLKEAATKSWRRDLQMTVSSLVLGLTNGTTISTRGAFSTGRVPVGRGL